MLLSWKDLGHITALDSLITWAKNETATTRRRKTQEFGVILGNRYRGHHVVKVANIAGEATIAKRTKDKIGAPGATGDTSGSFQNEKGG